MKNLNITQWQVDKLIPYARPLKSKGKALPKMVDALSTWGFRAPLLVSADGQIIDGHLRFYAAVELGMQSVPVLVADDMSSTQVRTFRLMVNRSATWADWNDEHLRIELAELRLALDNMAITGFSDRELDSFLQGVTAENEQKPDDAPALRESAVSAPGDIWLLGQHRLVCGDATRADDIALLMDGELADMVWTDPPYNVDYSGKAGKIKNDKMSAQEFDAFLRSLLMQTRCALREGGGIYVAHSEAGNGMAFRSAFFDAGLRFSSCLIWRKNQMVIGRSDYHWQHEPILYGWNPGTRHFWHGDRKQKTLQEYFAGEPITRLAENVWQVASGDMLLRITGANICVEELGTTILSVPKPQKSDLHPTMKPVALVERMVCNSSPRGGLVYDPCGGSGTTLIACERMARRCNTMELDPCYADVIIRRWQDFTGQRAQHALTGSLFEDAEGKSDA